MKDMKCTLIWIVSLCVVNLAISQDEYSVQSKTKGFSLAADVGLLSWTSTKLEFEGESGFCYGLQAALGLNHQWTIYAQAHFASIVPAFEENDNYPLFDGNFGVRYFFGSTSTKWRPSIGAHLNYTNVTTPVVFYQTGDIYEMDYDGFGAGGSAALNYYLTDQLSLLAMFQVNFGNSSSIYLKDFNTFEEFKIDEDYKFSSWRFGIGLSYNFSN